jgi:hypothetical protein
MARRTPGIVGIKRVAGAPKGAQWFAVFFKTALGHDEEALEIFKKVLNRMPEGMEAQTLYFPGERTALCVGYTLSVAALQKFCVSITRNRHISARIRMAVDSHEILNWV